MYLFNDFIKHTHHRLESAVVLNVHGLDSSTQHIVATYPTEVFSGDGTMAGGEGEMLTMLPEIVDFIISVSITSRRFVATIFRSVIESDHRFSDRSL